MFTHNDKSPVISEWSTEKLKREEAVYNDLINGDMPCYGRRDILIYSAICKELEKRGVIALTD